MPILKYVLAAILIVTSLGVRTLAAADATQDAAIEAALGYRRYDADLFQLDVPATWRQVRGTHGLAFAPPENFRTGILTLGIDLGVVRGESRDLQSDTNALISFIRLANSRLRVIKVDPFVLAGHPALVTLLSNTSSATGASETVRLITAYPNALEMFFVATIAPAADAATYSAVSNISSARYGSPGNRGWQGCGGMQYELKDGVKAGLIAAVAILMGLAGVTPSDADAVAGQNGPTILFHSDPQPLKIGENKFEVMVKDGKTPVKNADVSLELLSPESRQAHVVLRLKY